MAFFLVDPFGRATYGRRLRDRDRFARQQGIDSKASVALANQRFARTIVDATFVAQCALLIENEYVWRGSRPIQIGSLLIFSVVEIWKVEVPVRGANLHLFE